MFGIVRTFAEGLDSLIAVLWECTASQAAIFPEDIDNEPEARPFRYRVLCKWQIAYGGEGRWSIYDAE